jgi:integrase
MTESTVPEGVEVRRFTRRDGTVTEVFSVRVTDVDGTRRRRSFDSLEDALDYRARLRSARRWRPEDLRQEQAGTQTLGAFFEQWWVERAMPDRASDACGLSLLWEAHAAPRLARLPMREIDARRVVAFRGELLAAGVGPTSVVKTMAMLQRVFRDAVEYGDVAFKAVRRPSPGPSRVARPLTPLQVERLVADLERGGSRLSAVLVRLMAYSGLRPQEALALHWYAVRKATLLVELANADGQLDRLKNRKRSRKRSRTVDLMTPIRLDLLTWRQESGAPDDGALVFPHEVHGRLWFADEYRNWRRRVYVPSVEAVGLPSRRPYDLRHTWASLLIAEKRLSTAEIAEQLGDKTSTVLDTYTHVLNEWRGAGPVDIEAEIRDAADRAASALPAAGERDARPR